MTFLIATNQVRKVRAGSWLADLAALEKAITLCDSCVRKWNPASYGYVAKDLWPGQKFVLGECDACGCRSQCTLMLKEK